MKHIESTITSVEVAKMVGKDHKNILRDIKVYESELDELKIEPISFFQSSSYTDKANRKKPCFNVTKKGCEFIAHKLTGIKGTAFTAKYINRFHEMEDVIREEIPKKDEPKKKNLSATNMLIKNVSNIFEKAGVNPTFIAAETKRLYKEQAGIDISIPLITDKEDMPKLYDCTEIARELGIMSSSGKPHNQAVSAILSKLMIDESEIVTTAFTKNGHDDVTTQYKPSVFNKVRDWLDTNDYPVQIPYTDSKGNYKTYKVNYQNVEVA